MFDKSLVLSILIQIEDALKKIASRAGRFQSADDFTNSSYVILDPAIRWFPADEALRESSMDKLMPPLVPQLRRKVKEWRGGGYVGGGGTTKKQTTQQVLH